MMPAMGNLSYINYAITCCVGGLLAIRSGDLGGLSAFLQYTRQVSQPITQISQQVNTILSAVAGAERVFEIMEAQPEVDEGKVTLVRVTESPDGALKEAGFDTGAWAWKKPDGTLIPLRGDVRFDHVVFGYDDRKIILHDISLFAKPGQKIAFVGSTGAGKTTITSLKMCIRDSRHRRQDPAGVPAGSARHHQADHCPARHLRDGCRSDPCDGQRHRGGAGYPR